jgi:hypothetical protein
MTKSRTNSKHSSSRGRKARKRSVPRSSASSSCKTARLIALLSKPEGVTVEMMAHSAGWQSHSIRGFLAGHVRNKLGLKLGSEKGPEGVRRYRIIQG